MSARDVWLAGFSGLLEKPGPLYELMARDCASRPPRPEPVLPSDPMARMAGVASARHEADQEDRFPERDLWDDGW